MATIPGRVAQWMPHARAAELVYGVDALLLLALLDRESHGGEALHPRGPGGTGDGGNGYGLGQIDGRYHATFIAARGPDGKPLWADPAFAILYSAKHLHCDIHRFEGRGINPVLPSLASYNAARKGVDAKLRELSLPTTDDQVIAALDPLTTGGNYVSDVMRRRNSYVLSP